MLRRTSPRAVALIICSRDCASGKRNDLSVKLVRSCLLLALSSSLVVLFELVASAQDTPKVEIVLNLPHVNNVTSVAFSPDGTRALSDFICEKVRRRARSCRIRLPPSADHRQLAVDPSYAAH
jgi:hypothetical protein